MIRIKLAPLLASIYLLTAHLAFAGKSESRSRIDSIINVSKADVGVAIMSLEDHDTLYLNSGHHPMQSVYKFPLAIAVLHMMEQKKMSLNYKVHVSAKDLLPNTHSPLRDQYPKGDVDVSLGELLSYMVSQSDNNACDILFRLVGGPEEANKYIHSLGVSQIAIVATEEQMHKEWSVQFTNWSEPGGMLQLLDIFYNKCPLSSVNKGYLMKTLVEANTGAKRIKAGVPDKTQVAHKTGTSSVKDGVTAAQNDAGIVALPNGKHFAIVTFVSNSNASEKENDTTIAAIARTAWEYYISK